MSSEYSRGIRVVPRVLGVTSLAFNRDMGLKCAFLTAAVYTMLFRHY